MMMMIIIISLHDCYYLILPLRYYTTAFSYYSILYDRSQDTPAAE